MLTDGNKELSILVAGPTPPPLGGTTVLFERLVHGLDARDDLSVRTLDTGGVRHKGLAGVSRLLRLLSAVDREARTQDVVTLHVSTSGLHVLGPPVAWLARRRSTPLIIRKFGGTDFLEYSSLRRGLIMWALRRADLYLAETKELVRVARDAGFSNADWYPNSRPMPELPDASLREEGCRRFVFLGQIHSGKGIRELLDASDGLPAGATVSIFGTLGFDVAESDFAGRRRVSYRGPVSPKDVHRVLSEHDALVLPSHHHGEGYPGVILEAYAAGLPVISTRWRAIPELVEEDVTGLLVPPYEAETLRLAMVALFESVELYARLREGVRARRDQYSDVVWQDRFVDYCRRVAGE